MGTLDSPRQWGKVSVDAEGRLRLTLLHSTCDRGLEWTGVAFSVCAPKQALEWPIKKKQNT